MIRDLTAIASNRYLCPTMTSQVIAYRFRESGRLDAALASARAELRSRRDTMVDQLRAEIPEAKFTQPAGGYFLWVDMPTETSVAQLAIEAEKLGVLFTPGEEGVQRLAAATRSLGAG